MKLLFLRGFVPNDQNPKNVMYDSLENNWDMWENLACSLGDERTEIIYLGGKRNVRYNEKFGVSWVKDADHLNLDFTPDIVFARGGFSEWVQVVRKFPDAKRIYYGSGVRVVPESHDWNVVLCDTKAQEEKLRAKGFNPLLWVKPASPLFTPVDTPKIYDVCYVGDGRFPFRADIKRVSWFCKTVPKHLACLHLGWKSNTPVPSNVHVHHVHRSAMPLEYSRCRVLAVPYKDYDSAPRVIPEALACGLNVVAMDSVNFNNANGAVLVADKKHFWETVETALNKEPVPYVTFSESVEYLRRVLL